MVEREQRAKWAESAGRKELSLADHRSATQPRRQHNVVPLRLPRRGLSREEAAIYVGVSITLFDALVADGRMPRPFRINSRVLWDIRKLDVAIDALDTNGTDNDGWGGMQL